MKAFLRYLNFVLNWLRCCACCGRYQPPCADMCRNCKQKLIQFGNHAQIIEKNLARPLKQPGYEFTLYSLFTWTPETEAVIRPMVYAMKGSGLNQLADQLMQELLIELNAVGALVGFGRGAVLVPAPARSFSQQHAQILARALGDRLGIQVQDLLSCDEGVQKGQKFKRRQDRKDLHFKLRRELNNSDTKRVVFVDDVVTTGSTVRAAYEALGRPKNFQVWSLVCRPKLAVDPRI